MGVLGAAGPTGGRCQCVDDLLAPIRSKMKVLKKFKKRMGLGAYACLFSVVKTLFCTPDISLLHDLYITSVPSRITPDSARVVQ